MLTQSLLCLYTERTSVNVLYVPYARPSFRLFSVISAFGLIFELVFVPNTDGPWMVVLSYLRQLPCSVRSSTTVDSGGSTLGAALWLSSPPSSVTLR